MTLRVPLRSFSRHVTLDVLVRLIPDFSGSDRGGKSRPSPWLLQRMQGISYFRQKLRELPPDIARLSSLLALVSLISVFVDLQVPPPPIGV